MPPLVVGFDLDMTLIDSRPGVIATFDALNAELGTESTGSRSRPGSVRRSSRRWPRTSRPGAVDAVCDRYRALYADLGPPGSSLLPGAVDAFAAVRARAGVTLVITAKYGPNAHRCLDHVGLAADHVVGWRHGPQKAETLLEHGAHVYVGDTVPDIEAARLAGARAVGVPPDRCAADELRAAGADVVLDTLTEFPAWLGTWR